MRQLPAPQGGRASKHGDDSSLGDGVFCRKRTTNILVDTFCSSVHLNCVRRNNGKGTGKNRRGQNLKKIVWGSFLDDTSVQLEQNTFSF